MPAPNADAEIDHDGDAATAPVFSPYGIGSALLGLVAVAALVLAGLIWSGQRDHLGELEHRTRVMQTAVDWTDVLINMNVDTVDSSLVRLHEGTVGQLNADFDAAITPYREVVQTLQSATTGRIEAVAYESVHHDLDTPPGSPPPPPPLPPEMDARTDYVILIASSVSQNVAGEPQNVNWRLRLGVSDVDGDLFISRLESLR